MSTGLIGLFSSIAISATVFLFANTLRLKPGNDPIGRYVAYWNKKASFLRRQSDLKNVPAIQIALSVFLFFLAIFLNNTYVAFTVALSLIIPPLLLNRMAKKRKAHLALQLDGTLTALANALSTTPNLIDAFSSLLDSLPSPMLEEIKEMLSKVSLGKPLSDALDETAKSIDLPGFDAACIAVTLGRKTGGNLRGILTQTAESVREMDRLEGVLQTKTAEGRNQAIVMGLVPPALIAILQWMDPNWLAPMWTDPIGWILLSVAAILEIAAVVLIRKIMAVDL